MATVAEQIQEAFARGLGLPGIRQIVLKPLEEALGVDVLHRVTTLGSEPLYSRALHLLTRTDEPERGIFDEITALPAVVGDIRDELGVAEEPVEDTVWWHIRRITAVSERVAAIDRELGERPEWAAPSLWETADMLNSDIGAIESVIGRRDVADTLWGTIGTPTIIESIFGHIGERDHFLSGYNYEGVRRMRTLTAEMAARINTEIERLTGVRPVRRPRAVGFDGGNPDQLLIGAVPRVEAGQRDFESSLAQLFSDLITRWQQIGLYPNLWTMVGQIARRVDDLSVLKGIIPYVEEIPTVIPAFLAMQDGLTALHDRRRELINLAGISGNLVMLNDAALVRPLLTGEQAVADVRTIGDALTNITYLIERAASFITEIPAITWDTLTDVPEWIRLQQIDWDWLTGVPAWVGLISGRAWTQLVAAFPWLSDVVFDLSELKKNFASNAGGLNATYQRLELVAGEWQPVGDVYERVDARIDRSVTYGSTIIEDLTVPAVRAVWRGWIKIPYADTWKFRMHLTSGWMRVNIGGVINDLGTEVSAMQVFEIGLDAGFHEITVTYNNYRDGFMAHLEWEVEEAGERVWRFIPAENLYTAVGVYDRTAFSIEFLAGEGGAILGGFADSVNNAVSRINTILSELRSLYARFQQFINEMGEIAADVERQVRFYLYEREDYFEFKLYDVLGREIASLVLRPRGIVNYPRIPAQWKAWRDRQRGFPDVDDAIAVAGWVVGAVGDAVGEMFSAIVNTTGKLIIELKDGKIVDVECNPKNGLTIADALQILGRNAVEWLLQRKL